MRYISIPNQSDTEEVKTWIGKNQPKYDYGNSFDMAVDCAYDLEIFDQDEFLVDQKQTHSIPQWIVDLCEILYVSKRK